MPGGANQFVDDAVTADIFANRPKLPVEDERPRMDATCLVSDVAPCEHLHEQWAQQFRVGKPVDEIGVSSSGFRVDGYGVVRWPQIRMIDPDRSSVCIDEDGFDSIPVADAPLRYEPADRQVIEVLRGAQPFRNQASAAAKLDLYLWGKRGSDTSSSEIIGERSGQFDVVRPFRLSWSCETKLFDVLQHKEIKKSVRSLDPPEMVADLYAHTDLVRRQPLDADPGRENRCRADLVLERDILNGLHGIRHDLTPALEDPGSQHDEWLQLVQRSGTRQSNLEPCLDQQPVGVHGIDGSRTIIEPRINNKPFCVAESETELQRQRTAHSRPVAQAKH